jgi:hypothetical protein
MGPHTGGPDPIPGVRFTHVEVLDPHGKVPDHPVGPTCRRQFSSPARSLSLSRGPGSPVAEPLPRTPLSPLSVPWTLPVSSAPSALAVDRRVHTHARRRISWPRRPHAPSSLLRAPPVPRAHPSPHFAQLRPLSRSTHAASHRRRPAPAFPTIQLAGDHAKPLCPLSSAPR